MPFRSASLGLAAAIVAGAWAGAGPAPAGPAELPNVVVITTDDQDRASVRDAMPVTLERIGEQGTTFDEALVNLPLCCPSRASFLTGQYPHNNGVVNNLPPRGGFQGLDHSETLATWLEDAGYYTALIGKYLNGYEFTEPPVVPEGWSEWHGMHGAALYLYYGYKLFEDGLVVTYGEGEDPEDPLQPGTHNTTVLTDKAVALIEQRAPDEQPFFLWLNYLAPHGGGPGGPGTRCFQSARPAIDDLGDFDGEPLPAPPSLNERNVSDKPPIVRRQPLLDADDLARLEVAWQCQRETVAGADRGIGEVLDALEASGELANTLVVFTSDNGFLFGQHRYFRAKRHPYEEAIRVPLMIRGPGFPAGARVREPAFNHDLAATILEASGVSAGLPQDGRRLQPLARRPERRLGRDLLIRGPGWIGVRNARFTYVERLKRVGGGVELYDLRRDPFQVRSVHRRKRYRAARRALERRLGVLRHCRGRSCRRVAALRLRVTGPRCGTRAVRVRAAGRDRDRLASVRFATPAGTRTDRRAPFELSVRRVKVAEVTARATLIDGRITTLAAARPPRC